MDGTDGVRVWPVMLVCAIRGSVTLWTAGHAGRTAAVVRAAHKQVEAEVAVDVGAQGEDQAVGTEADLTDAVASGEWRVVPTLPQRQHVRAEEAADQ
ncbi:hypothetical protein AB0O22_26180 [Streptomyces sp. NPDC091204]|uniref:hypothetical protein n=1 Tax=Streptomyces sp. NPDC091204 TaxID=3155299 RepID=UPI003429EDA2